MQHMLTSAVSDDAIRAAVQELFAPPQRRLLGGVLTANKPANETAPLRETFPAALREVLKTNSAGEGNAPFEAIRANPKLKPLVNAEPERVVSIAAQTVAELPSGSQTHRQAVEASFSRAVPRQQAEVVAAQRPPVSPGFFRVPGLVGQA